MATGGQARVHSLHRKLVHLPSRWCHVETSYETWALCSSQSSSKWGEFGLNSELKNIQQTSRLCAWIDSSVVLWCAPSAHLTPQGCRAGSSKGFCGVLAAHLEKNTHHCEALSLKGFRRRESYISFIILRQGFL